MSGGRRVGRVLLILLLLGLAAAGAVYFTRERQLPYEPVNGK